jgi:hypothetical protein
MTKTWQIVGLASVSVVALIISTWAICKCKKRCSQNSAPRTEAAHDNEDTLIKNDQGDSGVFSESGSYNSKPKKGKKSKYPKQQEEDN